MECSDKCPIYELTKRYTRPDGTTYERACIYYDSPYCLYPEVHAFQMERMNGPAFKPNRHNDAKMECKEDEGIDTSI